MPGALPGGDRRPAAPGTGHPDILYLDIEGRTVVIHTVEGALPAGRSFSTIAELLLSDERFSRATAACW